MVGNAAPGLVTWVWAPIWIAETGVNIDASTGARLAAYVAAIRAARLRGLLYFNERQYALPGGDLAALATAINSPGRGTPGKRGAPGKH